MSAFLIYIDYTTVATLKALVFVLLFSVGVVLPVVVFLLIWTAVSYLTILGGRRFKWLEQILDGVILFCMLSVLLAVMVNIWVSNVGTWQRAYIMRPWSTAVCQLHNDNDSACLDPKEVK